MSDPNTQTDNLDIPVDFNTFVLSLSSSAVFHLGIAPHPDANSCCTNLPLAKQTIDILEMLRDKTQGNLNGEEERLLDDVIDNLNQKYEQLQIACGCE